jgi:hypothetical protein
MKAHDFLQSGETVMVIFTRGGRFDLRADHTGATGNWVIDPNRKIDRVIIYHRNEDTHTNLLYIGCFIEAERTTENGRYNIHLAHIQYIGKTEIHWKEFAGSGQNPIRYLP